MKKGIIFDMDGTLWDSAAEVAESWNETVKRAGYDRKPITVKDIQSVMGKTMDVIARILFPDLLNQAKFGVLLGTIVAGMLGYMVLNAVLPKVKNK